jgi:thiazole synthase
MKNPDFLCNGLKMSRVWHCFGNYMHQVTHEDVELMLAASKTNVLPINTHQLNNNNGMDSLIIGFGNVKFDDLATKLPIENMTIMLNINHQTNAKDAIKKTLRAFELIEERVIKIEVLNKDLKTSNNIELIKAIEKLNKTNNNLILMPLLECNLEDAKKFVDLGCPLLRVMGSPIGSGSGIINCEEFSKICELGIPVVIDGGVGSANDFAIAVDLGASGCLVNSMLFEKENHPAKELRKFMEESQPILKKLDKEEKLNKKERIAC